MDSMTAELRRRIRLAPSVLSVFAAVLALALCVSDARAAGTKAKKPAGSGKAPSAGAAPLKLSGPYTHENLSVYLIHGPDRIKVDADNFLTLQEALERKVVVVHETGDVNELAIENKGKVPVFVQSGDIVKGGQQDRTIATDFICPPKSGRVPVESFCVEHGRWAKRGEEDSKSFSGSAYNASGRKLKLAAKNKGGQQEVWDEVAVQQQKLSRNVGGQVAARQSESSLQLSLENDKLRESVKAYEKSIAPAVDSGDKSDVVGYAVAINGQITNADVYASSVLFRKMWPKLLHASSVEALAEKPTAAGKSKAGKAAKAKFTPPAVEEVHKFLADAERGKAEQREVNARTAAASVESADAVLLESRDNEQGGEFVHREYLKK